MKKPFIILPLLCCGVVTTAWCAYQSAPTVATSDQQPGLSIISVNRLNPTTIELIYADGKRSTVDLYADNILRIFRDDNGGIVRNPVADPPAEILVPNPRTPISELSVTDNDAQIMLQTKAIKAVWNKATGLMTITDLASGKIVLEETAPVAFDNKGTMVTLSEGADEYFYGGGVQNGRFSHKGRAIAIENQNSWTDGGVASPNPFYWSTNGYGIMFHTFKPGTYDFGADQPGTVTLRHKDDYLDMFVMVDSSPAALLGDFYQLTGKPVLLPKFGFYEGHLNAYNRDYWAVDTTGTGVLFEDGIRYKESQRDNGGIKESLNGEKNNYQFSARAVVDRYAKHDMPLGWILPNDGYGAGYGQTETLEGNVANLREFGDYARSKGVEIGLWTQSDLHPKEGISALLQRDIVREVRDAGVRVLKTDVAWVGWGYSFGLNGVSDVGEIMPYYGNDARPFIISLDGWAGTQRYATVWSGDQTGGEWEYIRFHIPTYIGSGLSGQPNITSDMDGIFGGRKPIINIRDFQWKTFTPMELNMDGWGSNEKYPHALGEPATSINRNYLKLKSQLLPYAYTYAREAVDGKPLIRAIFLEDANPYTLGSATKYEYLYGPDFLVAPIYQNTASDEEGNDVRHNIYLPQGTWYDYFNGDKYDGGVIINSYEAPIWKLPVFVRAGAIIPMVNPNNNPSEIDNSLRIYEFYPQGRSEIAVYDDDGTTMQYTAGTHTSTVVTSDVDSKGRLEINIQPTTGRYDGFVPTKATELIINVSQEPKSVTAKVNGKKVKLAAASSLQQFNEATAAYYYNPSPSLNNFSTPGSDAAGMRITKNPQLMVKIGEVNTATTPIALTVDGFVNEPASQLLVKSGELAQLNASIPTDSITPFSITPIWDMQPEADYYEIEFDGMLYSTIRQPNFLFEDLKPETDYAFNIRAVNAASQTPWTALSARTLDNPYQWAIRGIQGETSCRNQEGFGTDRLFDFSEGGDLWHTKYQAEAVPFDLIIDLRSYNTLDRLRYVPRANAGNGTLLHGTIAISRDKKNWEEVGEFEWARNSDAKEFAFAENPNARYIKMSVDKAVGNYGSGSEIYVFKKPNTESAIPGDINSDGRIDEADLMSYTNYTGLRRGDSDFEGYISVGDVNGNELIDACDISYVATQLDGGVIVDWDYPSVDGNVIIDIPRGTVPTGEELTITVRGEALQSVNALSFALPYDAETWEFVGVEPIAVKDMENMTYDRLHTNGTKSLYPTFVNIGDRDDINGDAELMLIRFRAKKKASFSSAPTDLMLVDKYLNEKDQ